MVISLKGFYKIICFVVSSIAVISIAYNLFLFNEVSSLHNEIDRQKKQYEEQLNNYQQDKYNLEDKLNKINAEYQFYHQYAVITTLTGYRYHKYGCYHLNNDNGFYIYNIDNAAFQGYTPCLDCLGSGSTEEIKDKLERELY